MLIARALFAALIATPLLHAGVIVVDAEGGGDFTTVTAAVAAAVNGDTILIRDGEYVEAGPVDINGKALTITGEAASGDQWPGASIEPGLLVRNLPAGKFVVIESLVLHGAASTAAVPATGGLVLHDNQSHVRVQSCALSGGEGAHNSNPDGAPAVEIINSYSTALIGCDLNGGEGQFSPNLGVVCGDGGPGVYLSTGQLQVGYCWSFGGPGGSNSIGGFAQGGVGGAGIRHVSGTLFIVSSAVNGGQGGTSHFGGDGGDGLVLGSTGFAWLMAGTHCNGADGGFSDVGPMGEPGVAFVDPSGLVVNHGGLGHDFEVTSPLREGQSGVIKLGGQHADMTLLFASLAPHQIAFPSKQGVLMLSPAALIGPFVLGPASIGELPITGPNLPASLEALNVHLQAIYVGGDGVVLGPGRVLTLLDASF